jgi:hypothetical protein
MPVHLKYFLVTVTDGKTVFPHTNKQATIPPSLTEMLCSKPTGDLPSEYGIDTSKVR